MKAALIGIGNPHSLGHLRTLQQLPEVEEIHIWGDDGEALASIQQSDQGEKVADVYTDLDALLSQEDIFFAIVAMRPDVTPDTCMRALKAGKHVLCEKPLGRTAADVEPIVAAAEQAGLQLGVCYTNRHSPVTLKARSFVQHGLIGPLMSVEMRMVTTQVKKRDPNHWLFNEAYSGGGILAWLGCHFIDMMRFVTGEEIVSVSAEVNTRSGEDIDVEDVATLSVRFQSGAVGSLHAGYIMALSGEGYFNTGGNDIYNGFNGQKGRIFWDPMAAPLRIHVETTVEEWKSAPVRDYEFIAAESPAYGGVSGEEFVRDFIRAGQGEDTLPASGRDALQAARIIDAAYESSRTGRRIEVELPG